VPAGRPAGRGKVSGSGRKKGSRNKRTLASLGAVDETLRRAGVDPILVLANITKSKRAGTALKLKAAAELAQYVYPKRKAVEVSTPTAGAGHMDELVRSSKSRPPDPNDPLNASN
jgi:hypothetical protein